MGRCLGERVPYTRYYCGGASTRVARSYIIIKTGRSERSFFAGRARGLLLNTKTRTKTGRVRFASYAATKTPRARIIVGLQSADG